jgi:hypothetical protein
LPIPKLAENPRGKGRSLAPNVHSCCCCLLFLFICRSRLTSMPRDKSSQSKRTLLCLLLSASSTGLTPHPLRLGQTRSFRKASILWQEIIYPPKFNLSMVANAMAPRYKKLLKSSIDTRQGLSCGPKYQGRVEDRILQSEEGLYNQ